MARAVADLDPLDAARRGVGDPDSGIGRSTNRATADLDLARTAGLDPYRPSGESTAPHDRCRRPAESDPAAAVAVEPTIDQLERRFVGAVDAPAGVVLEYRVLDARFGASVDDETRNAVPLEARSVDLDLGIDRTNPGPGVVANGPPDDLKPGAGLAKNPVGAVPVDLAALEERPRREAANSDSLLLSSGNDAV